METTKSIFYTIGITIGAFVALFVPSLIGGALLMVAWNAIAWEFNLPQFGYWICVCVFYVLRALTARTVSIDSKK